MKYNDGIDPDTIEEDDLDINNAKAGENLFQSNQIIKHEVDSENLFMGEQVRIEKTQEDIQIFEEKVEFVYNQEDADSVKSTDISTMLVLIICAIVILSYIYYFIQKRSIVKELKSSNEKLNIIQ